LKKKSRVKNFGILGDLVFLKPFGVEIWGVFFEINFQNDWVGL
jgi:hypothetical protein